MKLQSLDIKKLRKKSITVIRSLIKQYNLSYSIMEDKEQLIEKLAEIQQYSRKTSIYLRHDFTF